MKVKKLEAGQIFFQDGKLFLVSKFKDPKDPKKILAKRIFFQGFTILLSQEDILFSPNDNVEFVDVE